VGVGSRAAMRSQCLTRIHASLGRNRLAAEDRNGARVSLEEGLAEAARHGHCATCNALLLPEAVRVELAWDDLGAADRYAMRLSDVARRFGNRTWRAMAEHARGRVHAGRGAADDAFASFERARTGYAELGFTYEAARCLAAQSRLVRPGEDARSRIDEVGRALAALGAAACDS